MTAAPGVPIAVETMPATFGERCSAVVEATMTRSMVAGSTLLSESVPSEQRPGVQGATDFVMGLCGASGGALAGVVLAASGYGALNGLAGLLVVPVVLLVLAARSSSGGVSRTA